MSHRSLPQTIPYHLLCLLWQRAKYEERGKLSEAVRSPEERPVSNTVFAFAAKPPSRLSEVAARLRPQLKRKGLKIEACSL